MWGGARHQTYIYLWVCSCVQAHTDILCRVVSRWWAWTALSALPPPHPSSLPLSPIIAGLIHPARFGNRLIRVISHNKQWPTQTAQRWLCSPQNIRTQKWALNTFHHQWWNIDISSFLLKKFIPVPQIFFSLQPAERTWSTTCFPYRAVLFFSDKSLLSACFWVRPRA